MTSRRTAARFNKKVGNRLVGGILPRLPGFGTIIHRGRRSGRTYRTPVKLFRDGGSLLISLPYGPDCDWAANVLAAGGCELRTMGHQFSLAQPRLIHDPSLAHIPRLIRLPLRWLHAYDFLQLQPVFPESPPDADSQKEVAAEAAAAVDDAADDDELALREQIQLLSDRAEIAELCDRYVTHLDQDRDNDDWLTTVFTDDAQVAFPTGEYQGLAGLAEFQQMGRRNYAASHHISANNYIELHGDRARVRVHLVAVHVGRREEPGGHFDIGGHYDAEAVRTPGGWRFQWFRFAMAWHSGQTPAELASS